MLKRLIDKLASSKYASVKPEPVKPAPRYWAVMRKRRRDQGKCYRCGGEIDRAGKSVCFKCVTKKHSPKTKKCKWPKCKTVISRGPQKFCLEHMAQARKNRRSARRRENRIICSILGLCSHRCCEAFAADGKKQCKEHATQYAESRNRRNRVSRSEQLKMGLCLKGRCKNKPSGKSRVRCAKHFEEQLKASARHKKKVARAKRASQRNSKKESKNVKI